MMKSCKQLLMSVACGVLLSGAAVAQNADNASDDEFASKIASGENVVLFKIHDVNPIKDEDGIVTDCEFGLTLYNRSPKSVDAATINLSWKDDGISEVIKTEEKEDLSSADKGQIKSLTQAQQPKTANLVSENLTAAVILPQIKPFRQVSLKSKIKSDRCFLMIEDADFSFTNCKVTEQSSATGNRRLPMARTGDTGGGDCKSLFRFVSPRDPEYYREFQKVSFNEEAKQRAEKRKKDVDELDASYKKMIESLNSTIETLESIK